MPLKAYPPGTRGHKYWSMRGTPIAGGDRIEESTNQTTREATEQYIALYEAELLRQTNSVIAPTFRDVAERYKSEKNHLDKSDLRRVDALIALLGNKLVTEVNRKSLVDVADLMGEKWTNATKNRAVIIPGAAILHYAAEHEWRDDIRIKRFKTKKSAPRDTEPEIAVKIIKAAPEGDEKLFLLWMFACGDRITDTLEVNCKYIDWKLATYRHYNSKNDRWREAPIDQMVIQYARKIKKYGLREGRLFPRWKYRWGVYKWLRPLTASLGVKFTPHMGRHSLGKWFKDNKASQGLTMERLGHEDSESSMIYQANDLEAVRKVTRESLKKALGSKRLW